MISKNPYKANGYYKHKNNITKTHKNTHTHKAKQLLLRKATEGKIRLKT